MPAVLDLWKKTSALPLGDRVFSLAFSQKAPYFATIRPRFTAIEPNRAELVITKRRRVHNHIGTVHAIALCNLAELCAGLCLAGELSIAGAMCSGDFTRAHQLLARGR